MNSEAEKAAVLEIWKEGNRALVENDWESYKQYWAHTNYIELIHSTEKEWIRGWEEIGSGYEAFFNDEPTIETEFSDISVHLSPQSDMAWLACKVSIRIEQEEVMEFTSWQTNIFEMIDGEWKLVHAHTSNIY